jgi:hypothetical protein
MASVVLGTSVCNSPLSCSYTLFRLTGLVVCAGRPSDVARDAALRLERKANKAAGFAEGEQDGSGGRRSSVMRLLGRKER